MDQHDIDTALNDMSVHDALAMLSWQSDMGADEAIIDTPVDRYQAMKDQLAARAQRAQAVIEQSRHLSNSGSNAGLNLGSNAAPNTQTQPPPASTPNHQAAPLSTSAPLGAAEAIEAAQKAAQNCKNLTELKEALNQFDGASSLKRSATQTVFGDGNPNADVMIIAEAPGREDDSSGVALSGPNGDMLNRMFAAINLTRSEFHVTNMIYWRPPGDRSPTDSEISVFKPFLDKHIELVNPKILILLGAKPAQTYLQKSGGIARLRGKWGEGYVNTSSPIPTLAIFHPSSLIKNPNQKRLAWQDLLSIQDKLSSF